MRASAAFLLVLAALAAGTGAASAQPRQLPALAPAANDGLKRAFTQGRLTEAQYALERARSLFRLGAVRREFGDVERPAGRDATLILRDLAVRARELRGADRREARRLLARPTDNPDRQGYGYTVVEETPLCGANMCFHWVGTSPDAPPDDDATPSTAPPQVVRTQDIFEEVWDRIVGAAPGELGYREPLEDGGVLNDEGPDENLDIYLVDIGGDNLFGYCATDDLTSPEFTRPVYCVVDNDYSAAQYGSPPKPDGFLKVTAAHEFFHAVQGAYDFFEDDWFMEGTATNMEETVYPTVNDNVNFLDFSPLTRPRSPLDRGGFGDSEYGSWIFWRFLEEEVYRNNPRVIRRVWKRAAWAFGPDDYSIQAVARVLRNDGRSLAHEFGRFGYVNRLRAYRDGRKYPRTPTHMSFRLGSGKRSTGWRSRRLDHLTTKYVSFRPRRRGVSRRARLRVDVQVARPRATASLILYRRNGTEDVRRFKLNRRGEGVRHVSFRRGAVRRVDLVLSNGSSRMRNCFTDLFDPPFYSCLGIPRDDRRLFRFRATLRR